MVDEQIRQGNEPDVSIFQNNSFENKRRGGFNWDETIDGDTFWRDVLHCEDFESFFEKYPKEKETIDSHYMYIVQDGTINGEDIIKTLESYGGVNESHLNGDGYDGNPGIYFITPKTKCIRAWADYGSQDAYIELVKTFYKEIKVKPQVKEVPVTLQEIADKFGVTVEALRIKE